MTLNPYESPAPTELPNESVANALSAKRLLSDSAAGMLVGATYGALGMSIMTTAFVGLTMPANATWSNFEQLLVAFVAGAFLGAILGFLMGGAAGCILGALFRLIRLEESLRRDRAATARFATTGLRSVTEIAHVRPHGSFLWAAISAGSLLASLLGVAGGMLLSRMGGSAGVDPASLIWCPLGGVLGGMLGALSGRKWVHMVGEPTKLLPSSTPSD